MNKEQFQRLVELLQCPINQDGYLMSEPHIASDGNTYEREAIAEWFKRSTTSPMTREPLDPTVTRNRFMERVIELVREVDPTLKLSPSSSMSAFARAVRLGESLDRFELSPLEFIVFVDELSQDAEIAALSHLTSFEEQGNHILYTIAQSARLTKEYFRIGGSPMVHGRAVGTATLPPEQFLTYEYFMQLRDVNVEGLSPRVRANYLCATQPETEEDLRAADLDARLAAAAAHAGPLFSDDELSEHKHALQRVGYLARHYAQRIRNGLIEIDVLTIAPELMVWPITACPIPKFGRGSHANHCEPLAFAFLSARRTAFVPDSGTVKLLSSQSTTLAHHAHALGLPAMAWAVASHPDFPINAGEPHITTLLGDCPECHYSTVSLISGDWRRNALLKYPQRVNEVDDPLLNAEFSTTPRVAARSQERTMALLRNTRCDFREISAKDWALVTNESALALIEVAGWPGRLKLLSPELTKKAVLLRPELFMLLPATTQKRLLKSPDVVVLLNDVEERFLTPKTLELYLRARQALGCGTPTQ